MSMIAATAPMLDDRVARARAWFGPALRDSDFVVGLPDACLAELDQVVAEQRKAPVPTLMLLPEHFALDSCRAWMDGIRERLDHGLGFVILDRLPVERWSRREATDVYWLLGSLLEPPVAQDWPGTMIYDVRHDGQPYTGETRTALTPEGLDMHNDSSMGEAPPNYISLLCLQTAKSGGKSSLSSAFAAHNHFADTRPDLLERLYRPFYRHHQEYQAPDAGRTNWYPVFTVEDGGLRIRFNARPIRRGYAKTGQVLDDAGAEAVEALDRFLGDPAHRHDFWMAPGQMQILNNRIVVHGRTPYVDHDEPEKRRHLLRLWLRKGDRRQFRG
ncbi:MAG: TauD/TfdA family dioxygenase [Alphaproteobacteria bacterium]|nr:TauD/TfdA family dioxygenase [Alphaproteobacteria bacterium]